MVDALALVAHKHSAVELVGAADFAFVCGVVGVQSDLEAALAHLCLDVGDGVDFLARRSGGAGVPVLASLALSACACLVADAAQVLLAEAVASQGEPLVAREAGESCVGLHALLAVAWALAANRVAGTEFVSRVAVHTV